MNWSWLVQVMFQDWWQNSMRSIDSLLWGSLIRSMCLIRVLLPGGVSSWNHCISHWSLIHWMMMKSMLMFRLDGVMRILQLGQMVLYIIWRLIEWHWLRWRLRLVDEPINICGSLISISCSLLIGWLVRSLQRIGSSSMIIYSVQWRWRWCLVIVNSRSILIECEWLTMMLMSMFIDLEMEINAWAIE